MAILDEPIRGTPTAKNYLNGEWVESKGEIIEVTNPDHQPKPIGRAESTRNQILTLTAALAEEV